MRGKAMQKKRPLNLTRDHPRLCGEKLQTFERSRVLEGSPPPMRGKAPTRTVLSLQHGITPAYAGKSPLMTKIFLAGEDHPRLCGEKFRKLVLLQMLG